MIYGQRLQPRRRLRSNIHVDLPLPATPAFATAGPAISLDKFASERSNGVGLLRHLAPGRIVSGDHESDGAQELAEVWPRKRHGLDRRPIKRPVGAYQEHARLTELRRLLDAG